MSLRMKNREPEDADGRRDNQRRDSSPLPAPSISTTEQQQQTSQAPMSNRAIQATFVAREVEDNEEPTEFVMDDGEEEEDVLILLPAGVATAPAIGGGGRSASSHSRRGEVLANGKGLLTSSNFLSKKGKSLESGTAICGGMSLSGQDGELVTVLATDGFTYVTDGGRARQMEAMAEEGGKKASSASTAQPGRSNGASGDSGMSSEDSSDKRSPSPVNRASQQDLLPEFGDVGEAEEDFDLSANGSEGAVDGDYDDAVRSKNVEGGS